MIIKKYFLIATFTILVSNIAFSQITYTFNGNGNWSDTANWFNRSVPPAILPKGEKIIVNPFDTGQCILNITQVVTDSGQITILPNKKLKLLNDLKLNKKELKNNVLVIDTTRLTLISDSTMLSQGIYSFTSNDSIPRLSVNDFIVGAEKGGYIRKITSAFYSRPSSGSQITGFTAVYNTVLAKLVDVVKNGVFSFNTPLDNSLQGASGNSLSVNIPTITYLNGPIRIVLSNTNISLNPNFNFTFNFFNSNLDFFEVSCKNAGLNTTSKVEIFASQSATASKTDTLKHFSKTFTRVFPIPVGPFVIPFPVVIVMDVDIIFKCSASVSANCSKNMVINTSNSFDLGAKYSNGQWQPIYNSIHNNSVTSNPAGGDANAEVEVSIGPKVSFKLYNVVGPYLSLNLIGNATGNISSPSLDWDLMIGTWLRTILGVEASFLGDNIFNYNKQWDTDTLSYKTPFSITKISGDNQTGQANEFLTQPVKVRILDELGNKQSNVPVYFTVTSGGGTVNNASILTDNNGYAEMLWKLGSQFGIQYLQVTAKKADGSFIQNAPIEFAATMQQQCIDTIPDSTFTDPRDGQVYTYQKIGSKVWMTKNLNYAAPSSWCHGNNATNCGTYGRLYDWNTALTVAPPGWHLPSNAEWTFLTNFLGGEAVAGGKMKSSTAWNAPNTGATNCSGFAGLPGGNRNDIGNYFGIGYFGYWWSSTEYNTTNALPRDLSYDNAGTNLYSRPKSYGFSVRCVRD